MSDGIWNPSKAMSSGFLLATIGIVVVRATAVRSGSGDGDAEVLAGDPKFSLLSNSKLNNKHTWQGIQRGKDKDPPAGMP